MGERSCFGGGPILSGTGLSGSDRDERVSNLLDTSREAVSVLLLMELYSRFNFQCCFFIFSFTCCDKNVCLLMYKLSNFYDVYKCYIF